MATTQEIIDIKYDIVLGQQQQQLKEIFSEVILGWGKNQTTPITTYAEFVAKTGTLDITNSGITTLKGFNHMSNITALDFRTNNLTSIDDVSGMVGIDTIYMANNNLTYIGVVSNLPDLEILSIGDNELTYIGRLNNLTSLNVVTMYNNDYDTATIDVMLSDLREAFDGGALISGGIQLQGNSIPTDGILNEDYVYLVGQGVSVTIDS